MKLIKANENDKDELLRFYHDLVGTKMCVWTMDYPSMVDIEFDLSRDSLFCMKNERGEIVATISIDDDPLVNELECWKKDMPAAELSRLGVRLDYQGQGIARRMLLGGMEELKKRGYKGVHFLVCKTNLKAINSYNKLKFDVVGETLMYDHEYLCYEKEFE